MVGGSLSTDAMSVSDQGFNSARAAQLRWLSELGEYVMSNDHNMELMTIPLSDPEPLLPGGVSSWLKESATDRLVDGFICCCRPTVLKACGLDS